MHSLNQKQLDEGVLTKLRRYAAQLRQKLLASSSLSIRNRKDVQAERRRLVETERVVFLGNAPSKRHLVAATSLQRAFPTVSRDRLEEAAEVLVDAMSVPGRESSPERLDEAAIRIADIFAPK